MEQSRYIDAESLPFTEAEVKRALELAGPSEEAERCAAEIVAVVRSAQEMQREAEAARARGSTDPDEISSPSWHVGDQPFAALWCLPDLSARVDELLSRRWEEWEGWMVTGELHRRGLRSSQTPPDDVVREVRRKIARFRGGWTRRKRAMADRLGVPRPDGSANRTRE
jgi:hypothetical protein